MSRFSPFNAVALTFGFAFLYMPIMLLVIYSFNENDLVTVWTGFSFKWYGEMFANRGFRDAAWVTIRVALISSTVATLLGMMAAVTLVRARVFFGRTLFTGMVYTPLVMPEVITGISLLLFFVNFNIDRGMETLIIAHITFTMAFATVVSCTAEKKNPNCVPKTKPPGAASRNFSTVMCPRVATSTKQYTTAAPHAR